MKTKQTFETWGATFLMLWTLSLKSNSAATNSRFAKAGVSCFHDSEVLNFSFMHLMKFSAENPRLRKAAKRKF